jgi:hypothetical protein
METLTFEFTLTEAEMKMLYRFLGEELDVASPGTLRDALAKLYIALEQ